MNRRLFVVPLLVGGLLAGCASTWRGSIGAVLAQEKSTGKVVVREAPSDMSAARAGVLVGDELIAIDGQATQGLDAAGIHARLEGDVGTKVRLLIRRAGEVKEYVLERGPFREAKNAAPNR